MYHLELTLKSYELKQYLCLGGINEILCLFERPTFAIMYSIQNRLKVYDLLRFNVYLAASHGTDPMLLAIFPFRACSLMMLCRLRLNRRDLRLRGTPKEKVKSHDLPKSELNATPCYDNLASVSKYNNTHLN
jgi:hypothetical protein